MRQTCIEDDCSDIAVGRGDPSDRRRELLASPRDPTAAKKAQTHCKNGHPFEGRNLIMRKNGCRGCRYQAKKKVA